MIKYITTKLLLEANEAAVREKRNRSYNTSQLKEILPVDGLFFIAHEYYHKKDEMRLGILLNEKDILYLDMSLLRYESLPIAKMNSDGEVVLEPEEIWMKRRPYPNGREWSEKVERKTIRKSNFAKKVKEAYKNQCAMCSVKNPKLLIAAHIRPTHMGGIDDISNGLCLCRNHDILYENGQILVSQQGEIIRKPEGCKVEFTHIRYPKQKDDYPSPENLEFRLRMTDQ